MRELGDLMEEEFDLRGVGELREISERYKDVAGFSRDALGELTR